MKLFEIVETVIDPEPYRKAVLHASAGAVTVFTGHVREWTKGIRTIYLAYEAYIPMAEKNLLKLGKKLKNNGPTLKLL